MSKINALLRVLNRKVKTRFFLWIFNLWTALTWLRTHIAQIYWLGWVWHNTPIAYSRICDTWHQNLRQLTYMTSYNNHILTVSSEFYIVTSKSYGNVCDCL